MNVESLPPRFDSMRGRNPPKVSVVVPSYNSARFLGQAIQSVLDQTFQDWEAIIVDDGSTDDTQRVVAAFQDPRIRYVHQENRGAAAALNVGVRLASGAYIAFLGADDQWLSEKLALQVAQLDGLPATVGLVYSDYELFDPENGTRLGRFPGVQGLPRGSLLSHLLRPGSFFIHPCATLIRREVFARVGLFDESLKAHEDWDLWVRIAALYEIEALDVPLTLYGDHPSQLTKDVDQMYQQGVIVKSKALRRHALGPEDRRSLRHYLASHHYSYGRKLLELGRRKEAWKAFVNSLRIRPARRETYVHLGLPLLSPRLYRWLLSLKRRVLPAGQP